jgi:tetratricopeptide (TPR) repeat protein
LAQASAEEGVARLKRRANIARYWTSLLRRCALAQLLTLSVLPAAAAEGEEKAPPRTLSEDAARAARAQTLLEEGTLAFERSDYTTALDRLTRAHALAPNYRSAATLGQLELELGHHTAAATHLDESLRLFPQGKDPAGFSYVMAGLAEARRHVCTVRVQSPTRGAELWFDGKRLGALPLDRDLFFTAGQHVLEVRAAGHAPRKEEQYFPAGGSRELTLALTPLAKPAPAARDTESAPAVVLWTGSALTALGLGVGIGFHVWSSATDDEATALRSNSQGCRGTDGAATCAELRRLSDAAAWRSSVANGALAGSALLAVATLSVYALLNDEPETEVVAAPTWSLIPVLGTESSGLSVEGAW